MNAGQVVVGPAADSIDRSVAARMLVSAAWMSVALGLLAQIVVVIGFVFFGEQLAGAKDLIRDTAKSMLWPLVVCVGIAAGKVLAMLGNLSTQAKVMGLAGMLAAPIGLTAARLAHRSLGEAMSLGPKEIAVSLFVALVVVKVFQYGFIGAALGRIQSDPNSHWLASLSVGLLADAIFGVAALVTLSIGKSMTTADWISNGVNEMLVPVGCSMIVFVTDRLARSA